MACLKICPNEALSTRGHIKRLKILLPIIFSSITIILSAQMVLLRDNKFLGWQPLLPILLQSPCHLSIPSLAYIILQKYYLVLTVGVSLISLYLGHQSCQSLYGADMTCLNDKNSNIVEHS